MNHYEQGSWERPVQYCSSNITLKKSLLTQVKDKISVEFADLKERCCIVQHVLRREKDWHCSAVLCHKHSCLGKAVGLILFMNMLYSLVTEGVASSLLQITFGTDCVLFCTVLQHGVAIIFYPIAGHIADCYISRYKIVKFSLWSAWASFAVLGVAFSFGLYAHSKFDLINRYITAPVTFIVMSISRACFMSSLIPFGLDQLQGAHSDQYSSFFYWWYWTLNMGVVITRTVQYCLDSIELNVMIRAEIGLACITVALVIDALAGYVFLKEPICGINQRNPLRQIAGVFCYVLRPPKRQHVPSSVMHELDFSGCNRWELAKLRYGGKFETEEVENVRSFFCISLLLLSTGLAVIAMTGVSGAISMIETHLKEDNTLQLITHWRACSVSVSTLSAVAALTFSLVVPLLDLILVPYLRHAMLHPSIMKRLGMGVVCVLLAGCVLLGFQGHGEQDLNGNISASSEMCVLSSSAPLQDWTAKDTSIYWLVLPVVVMTTAKTLINIAGFEFLGAQAPYNMRGLLVGMLFSFQASFAVISFLLLHALSLKSVSLYPFQELTGHSCAFWFEVFLVGVALLGLCLYLVAACKYKKRKRGDTFNQVGMIEDYFSSGRRHSSRWM